MKIFFRNRNGNRLIPKSFFVLFTFVSFFGFTHDAKAYWGEAIFAMLSDNVFDSISRQIEGAMLGSLKVAAIKALNSQISQLAGGGSGGQPVFVTDWNKFLNTTPQQQANLYIKNFFQSTTRGKSSIANYSGIGQTGGSVTGNYAGYLVSQAEKSIQNTSPVYDLDQYGNPNTMWSEGDFRSVSAFFKPANNPFGYTLMAENAYATELERQKEIAKTQAQSSGFIGVQKNGITVTPAGSVQAMVTDVQTLGNKMLAAATNPGEFMSGVVMSVVNTTVNQVVQRGVGEVQSSIQREVGNVNNQINNSITSANATSGPAANFGSILNQRTSVDVNLNTPPPPNARRGQ